MAHTAEDVGMAAFSLIGGILDELERQHPGSKQRILNGCKVACQQQIATNPGGNAANILNVINMI